MTRKTNRIKVVSDKKKQTNKWPAVMRNVGTYFMYVRKKRELNDPHKERRD